MTDEQKEFLRLHLICDVNYDTISERLNVTRQILSAWYEELKPEREIISKSKTIWNRKKFTDKFEDFYKWYLDLNRQCHYCGINEQQINALIEKGVLTTKRLSTRGRTLEFDRKNPNLAYSNLDNVVLCCYWCNNAKTDTFSHEEFLMVGTKIAEIWKQRLKLINH